MKNSKDRKNKKTKKLTKVKKIRILIVVVIIFMILSTIIAAVLTSKANNTEEDTIEISIKELVESQECTYISDCNSAEDGFDIDIYLTFARDTLVDGVSSEPYYSNVFSGLAYGTSFMNLRLIDESRDLIVRIQCEDSHVASITINGDSNYFETILSENAKVNPLEVDTISMNVNSQELQSLIENNWVTSQVDFGSQESTFNKYSIYFDEGIEVRTISKKVYNIVFTSKYTSEVVSNLKVTAENDSIKKLLGSSCYEYANVLGYKTEDFYVFFSDNEISIYPNYNYEASDYKGFEDLIVSYNEDQDINDFMDKLTDLWPDYDYYSYDTNYLEIYYTLKGVRIAFSTDSTEGIQIYENYGGNLKANQYNYTNVYYKVDENLIIKSEFNRIFQKAVMDYEDDEGTGNSSSLFYITYSVLDSDRVYKLQVRSITGEYPNYEFDDTIIVNTYIWADDTHLIYNTKGTGIYLYDATTRNTTVIVEGDDTYDITDYDRDTKVLTYDGNEVIINY